jgi:hypothetical protein
MNLRKAASVMAIWLIALFGLASVATAQTVATSAGPIWNNSDAQAKCPTVCSRQQMGWRGVWRTVSSGRDSECDCVGRGAERFSPLPDAHGPGSSCHVPSVKQCRGCSVSCRPGQSAHCQAGDVGIFSGPNDSICGHEARCGCQ